MRMMFRFFIVLMVSACGAIEKKADLHDPNTKLFFRESTRVLVVPDYIERPVFVDDYRIDNTGIIGVISPNFIIIDKTQDFVNNTDSHVVVIPDFAIEDNSMYIINDVQDSEGY